MRRLLKVGCALAALAAPPSASASAVTPVQKVVQLLEGMSANGKAEKHEEEVEFAKFQAWCDSTRAAAEKSIEEGAAQITQLSADIAKAESDAEVLGQEIAGLQSDIVKGKGEMAAAKKQREKERADYLAQEQDFSESIDACERAVSVLKSRSADVPQSLAQVQRSPLVPAHTKSLVQSFLALHATDSIEGAPEANAYEFQSGSVVDMLEKLTDRFKAELLGLQKSEMNARANFELLLQQLTTDLRADESAEAKKTAAKAGKLSAAGAAKGDLAATEQAKATDEKTLSDTNAGCHTRSAEFEQNQVTRAEELKAIAKAVEILTSDAVKGTAETYLPSLLQARHGQPKGRALAQLRSLRDGDAARARALTYLQGRAKDLGSRYLAVMASHLQEDPFAKVKSMIKDLIVKLMEEANAEADHHAYCTSELATNKQTREDKTREVEKLMAEADSLEAKAAQLATELTELSDSTAEMQGSRAEAAKMRGEEKTTNEKTITDAKAAQVAVEQAIAVLRSFYDKASEGAALLQARAKGGAAMASSTGGAAKRGKEPYTGMGGSSTGVLGMLDVILSDFARLETETSSAEDQAASAHEKFMDETAQELAVKATTQEHKEGTKQQTEETLLSTKKELSLTQEELSAATSYYDKLKADCVDTNLSYEDRVRMRKEEIQSLKEALRILNGEDSLV